MIFEFCYHITLIYNEYSNNIAERIGHYTQFDGVLGKISFCQMIFEFCYHITLIYNEYSNNIAERIGHYTQLPEGWSICKLSKLCKIENGFAFSSNDYKSEGTPLIRISNIVNNSIDLTDCVYIQNNAEHSVKSRMVLLLVAMIISQKVLL